MRKNVSITNRYTRRKGVVAKKDPVFFNATKDWSSPSNIFLIFPIWYEMNGT
jgi:hypothetical protein